MADASKLLGEKLLQGWTMLAESCPNPACGGVPLMRERGSNRMHCVACNAVYIPESAAASEPSAVAAPAVAAAAATAAVEEQPKPKPKPAAASATTTTTAGDVQKETAAVLWARIDRARAALAADPAMSSHAAAEHCSAIAECSKALAALLSVPSPSS